MRKGSEPKARAMAGSAVATTVPSRFCMNRAQATMVAVRRVRPGLGALSVKGGQPGIPQGMSTLLPVVLRASRAVWAAAASCRGKVWLTRMLTAPDCTTSNRSLAVAARSAGLAV